MRHLFILFKVLFLNRSSVRFAIGVCLGISFSIAVILSTIGLMDGFVEILEKNLKRSSGDIHFISRRGFFELDSKIESSLKALNINEYSSLIQSEAFIVKDNISRGVAMRGISAESYSKITGLEFKKDQINKGIYLGTELAKSLEANVGDDIILTLAKGNNALSELPLLKRFKVIGLINHGVYQQDLRFAYMQLDVLQSLINADGYINMVMLNIKRSKSQDIFGVKESIKQKLFDLEETLGTTFRFRPYWYDFSHLLEAVKVEKLTISMVLQIIVIISIFNALAFIIFLNEKRSKDIFLFQALGLSKKKLISLWVILLITFWVISCIISFLWIRIFDYALANLSIFQLPGHVYQLEQLSLDISTTDYILVFSVAIVWLLLISLIGLWKIARQPLLSGLRKEFS